MQLYGLNKQTLLVAAGRKKFGPSVQGGASVHDLDLLHEAEPALLGGGSERSSSGDGLPLDGVGHPLVLELPDVAGQAGSHPFAAVPEGVGVVVVPTLPVRLGQPSVGLLPLADCRHLRLVDGAGVQASGPLQGAVLRPSSAVAIAVEGPLRWEAVVDHLHVVPSYDLAEVGHGSVTQLDGVAVEDATEGVADWEAAVQDVEELLPNPCLHSHAVGWVEPDQLPVASASDPPCPLLLRLEGQLLRVAGPLKRLLVDPLGGIKDLL